MIDPETATTARILCDTFSIAAEHGALPQQLPALVVLLGRGLLLASLEMAHAESDLVPV